jgi:hypothetical protein
MTTPEPRCLFRIAELTLKSVDEFKKPDCVYYVKCMEFASDKDWPQFHCKSCKSFVRDPFLPAKKKKA